MSKNGPRGLTSVRGGFRAVCIGRCGLSYMFSLIFVYLREQIICWDAYIFRIVFLVFAHLKGNFN